MLIIFQEVNIKVSKNIDFCSLEIFSEEDSFNDNELLWLFSKSIQWVVLYNYVTT